MRRSLASAFVLVACSAERGGEPTEQARSALFEGRTSSDDENAFVALETGDEVSALRCSGTLLTPRLVVAARHCFLKRRSVNVHCNPDGTSNDLTLDDSLDIESPEKIKVFVGSKRDAFRTVSVSEVVAPIDGSVCGADIAFLVLPEPALDVRTPLRRAPVRLAEKVSVIGWGFTNDGPRTLANLPNERQSRDDIPLTEIGPGFIPAGMFAVGGGTLCLGDSGASARIGGAVVGVYSRIDGDPDNCGSEFARNVFQGVASQMIVVERAFEKIGETPVFIDDPPAATDAGPAPSPVVADASAAPPPLPPAGDSSCAAVATPSRGCAAPLVFVALVVTSVRRRRGRSARRAPRSSSTA